MRYNFTFAAFVSVLLAVAAMMQGVSGKSLYLGVALVTVALEALTRRTPAISSSLVDVHDEAQPTPPTDAMSTSRAALSESISR
jgi:hypothetical protein